MAVMTDGSITCLVHTAIVQSRKHACKRQTHCHGCHLTLREPALAAMREEIPLH